MRVEIRAGPRGLEPEVGFVVGPDLSDDVSVSERCQGLRESRLWETEKEKRVEEQGPILAVDEGSNRRDEDRGHE